MRPSSHLFYNRSNQLGQQIRSRDMRIVNGARGVVDDQPCLGGLSLTAGTSCIDACLREKDLRPIQLEPGP